MLKFQQQKPENAKFIAGSNQTPTLIYQDNETGEQVVVPNIWYNQPETWQESAKEFYKEMALREEMRLKALNRERIYQYLVRRQEYVNSYKEATKSKL